MGGRHREISEGIITVVKIPALNKGVTGSAVC